MPDGALVTVRDAAGVLERRLDPLRESMRASRTPLTLYLGIPRLRADAAAVGAPGEEMVPPPRFIRHDRTVGDLANPGPQTEAVVGFMRLNARILAGDSEREGCITLPCARLRYERDAFVLDERWIPPLVRVTRMTPLWDLLDRFAGEIRQTLRTLASNLGQAGGGHPLEIRAAAGVLGAGVAALEGLLSCECAPHVYYAELCRLLGAMCGFPASPGLEPGKPPDYRHENLMDVFAGLMGMIRPLLPTRSTAERFTFTQEDDRYVIAFKPEWETRDLYLAVRCADENDAIRWIERAVICSPGKLEDHWRNRHRGIPRLHVPSPPPELEVRAEGAALFALSLREAAGQTVRGLAAEEVLMVREGRFQEKETLPARPEEIALLIPEAPGA